MSESAIVLFTDYGVDGPYVGLMHAVIRQRLPDCQVIDLQHDLPPFRPRAAGLLLQSQLAWLASGSIIVGVVDPGVGTQRRGLIVRQGDFTFIAPDNGLLAPFLSDADRVDVIDTPPRGSSLTFHGRDWFAPVAASLVAGESVAMHSVDAGTCVGHAWAPLLDEVIYADRFGNLMLGRRGDSISREHVIDLGGHRLHHAATFAQVPVGRPFWHINSLGLVELAVNQGSAAAVLDLGVGDEVPQLG